ncbi:MAG: acyltransferase family protein [Candidatus Dormibacteria bacterium]
MSTAVEDRQTSSAAAFGRLVAVDGLRALAILMVFAFHAWQLAGQPAAVGFLDPLQSGVDLFVVLSGFCLFLPVVKDAGAAWRWSRNNFAINRARRIIPPYYAAIGLVVAVQFLLPPHTRTSSLQVLTHLAFVHTLLPETWQGIEGSFWSLGLEMQLYIALPFVVALYRRMGVRALYLAIAVSIAFRVAVGVLFAHAYLLTLWLLSITFIGRYMEFGAGMLAAVLVARRYRDRTPLSTGQVTSMLAGAAVAYTVAARVGWSTTMPVRDTLMAVAFGLLVVAVSAGRGLPHRVFSGRLLSGLGFMSYSFYLLHQTVLAYVVSAARIYLGLRGLPLLGFGLVVGMAVVTSVAYVFFRLVERPFMRPSTRAAAPAGLVRRESQPALAV